jgi:hypothetical protein
MPSIFARARVLTLTDGRIASMEGGALLETMLAWLAFDMRDARSGRFRIGSISFVVPDGTLH